MFTKIILLCKNIFHFGCFIPISNLLVLYGERFLPKPIFKNLVEKKHLKVKKQLHKTLYQTFSTWDNEMPEMEFVPDAPIWFCWFQGDECLPDIPSLCLKSIQRHANRHPINIITKDNYLKYVDIPEFVILLHKEGKMKTAHFCDIIRMSLLYKHGGLWMDATIFVTKDLSEDFFNYPFYSIKNEDMGHYISHCRWAGFFLSGWKNCPIYGALLKLYYAYLEKHTLFIDYLMMDYFIDILYQTNDTIKKLIDDVPLNNPDIYSLKPLLCETFDSDKFSQITQNTSIFKLDWRMYSQKDLTANKLSFYNYLNN